jgi:methylmalonyl-CoA/ethylmalonyl-CoA epimerase
MASRGGTDVWRQGWLMKIHHLGIAVQSLKEAIPVFELLLGRPPDFQEVVADQKVRVAVFPVGESRIELLEATAAESPVAKFIAKGGKGIHHLTLTVKDLPATLERLEKSGIRLIDRQPKMGAGGEKVAFLHPSSTSGVLIELVEEISPDGGSNAPRE